MEDMKTITLTHEDAVKLECFLLMTTNYRRNEAEAWFKLAEEKNEDGTPCFKNARSNAEWWEDLCARMEDIIRTTSTAPVIFAAQEHETKGGCDT